MWGGVEMRSRTRVSVCGGGGGGVENTTSIRRNMGNLPATFRQVKTYKIRLLITHVLSAGFYVCVHSARISCVRLLRVRCALTGSPCTFLC